MFKEVGTMNSDRYTRVGVSKLPGSHIRVDDKSCVRVRIRIVPTDVGKLPFLCSTMVLLRTTTRCCVGPARSHVARPCLGVVGH